VRDVWGLCYLCIHFVDAEEVGSHGGYPVCELDTTPEYDDCLFRPGIPRAGYNHRRLGDGQERAEDEI